MSKDKGGKNIKKAPAANGKKANSEYQNEKTTVSKIIPIPSKKK
ncbi:hypothetical protein [Mucilaginibacter sp. UR6-1]|nr:hypothetical protein [Mucilaginibacter sp. UR6-1]